MREDQLPYLMTAIELYVDAKVAEKWGHLSSKMTVPDARNQLQKVLRACCEDEK